MMIALALILFPKLALGMSGFETGVAVMTHVKGDAADTYDEPAGRIRNTKKLLVSAAVIMSAYLIASSLVTTWLIPAEEFKPGGEANGRALAYLAHAVSRRRLRHGLRRVDRRDPLVRRRFGDGRPAQSRPAVLAAIRDGARMGGGDAPARRWSITAISCLVTWLFDASVDAQGGAYATGVLVLFSSARVAVTLAARKAATAA